MRVGVCAMGATGVFFLSTNFAHWLFFGGYSLTLAGLFECYVAALPFAKYTLFGDLAWSAVFFGGHAALRAVPAIGSSARPEVARIA
jgi:hypothetical protein